MPTKVFTTMGGQCPFGRGIEIDSLSCRTCQYFYRKGTATFFWCLAPIKEDAPEQKTGKKRGRPPKNGQKRPVKARKTKNG